MGLSDRDYAKSVDHESVAKGLTATYNQFTKYDGTYVPGDPDTDINTPLNIIN